MYLTKEKADEWFENVPDDGAFILSEQSDEMAIYLGGEPDNILKLLAYTIKSLSLSYNIAIDDIYKSLDENYEAIKQSGLHAHSQDGYTYDLSNDFGINSEEDMIKLPPISEESKTVMISFAKDVEEKFKQIEPLISEEGRMSVFNDLVKGMNILPDDDGNPVGMRFEFDDFSFAYDIRYPDIAVIITDKGVGDQRFEKHEYFYEYVKGFLESIKEEYKERNSEQGNEPKELTVSDVMAKDISELFLMTDLASGKEKNVEYVISDEKGIVANVSKDKLNELEKAILNKEIVDYEVEPDPQDVDYLIVRIKI